MNSQGGAQYRKIDLLPNWQEELRLRFRKHKHDQRKMRGFASVMEKNLRFPSSGSVAMQLQKLYKCHFPIRGQSSRLILRVL